MLPNDIDKTKIEAAAKSEKAIIKYEDIDLKVGDKISNGISKIFKSSGKTWGKAFCCALLDEHNIGSFVTNLCSTATSWAIGCFVE